MGGGSAVNAQIAIRGLPSDYDEWQAQGADGWSWADVLPAFRRIERDMDFDGPLHGDAGRLPVSRTFPCDWGGLSLAFRDGLARRGVPVRRAWAASPTTTTATPTSATAASPSRATTPTGAA